MRDTGTMRLCCSCNRSTHHACEETMRGQAHPGALCIVCEMRALLIDNKNKKPLEMALKTLPTIMNNHIFHYREFFGHRSAEISQQDCMPHNTGNQNNVSKLAHGTRGFREALSLPPLTTSPASDFSRATTFLPAMTAGTNNESGGSRDDECSREKLCNSVQYEKSRGEQRVLIEYNAQTRHEVARHICKDKHKLNEEQAGDRARSELEKAESAGSALSDAEDSKLMPPYSSRSERNIRFRRSVSPGRARPATTDDAFSSNQNLSADANTKVSTVHELGRQRLVSCASSTVVKPVSTPQRDQFSFASMYSPVHDPMFSWDRRARTASDKMKREVFDSPNGRRQPIAASKILTAPASKGYINASTPFRTHVSGNLHLYHRKNSPSQPKVDCWREGERSRLEAAKVLPSSPSAMLEHKYRSTLRNVSAYVHDFKAGTIPKLQFPRSATFADVHTGRRRPHTERSEYKSNVRTEKAADLSLNTDNILNGLLTRRSRPGKHVRVDGSAAVKVGNKQIPAQSGFVSTRNHSYDAIIKFIHNELAGFGHGVRGMCQVEYTPQQFFEAVYNQQYRARGDGEPVDLIVSTPSSINSVMLVFQQHTEALHDIGAALANKLYMINETHGIKLTATQAILITMRDFGVFPTLLGTRQLTTVVLRCMAESIHGFPESDARRYQNILEAVLLDVALIVFRDDPEGLGIDKVVDQDADDSHMLQVLLIYMKLDQRSRVESFLTNFLSPQEADDKIEAEKKRTQNRDRMNAIFAGSSDPIKATIVRWQRPLQDIFHFFASQIPTDSPTTRSASIRYRVVPELHEMHNGGAGSELQVFYRAEPVAHESRKSLLRNAHRHELEAQNERKVRNLERNRKELLRKLNINIEADSERLRAAVRRVGPTAILMQSGKIDRAEATRLGACLSQPDALQESNPAKNLQSIEDLVQEKQRKCDKLRVCERIVANSGEERDHLILEDFVALYGGRAPAQRLWDVIQKKDSDVMDSREFVTSMWTDSLCAVLTEGMDRLHASGPDELPPLSLKMPFQNPPVCSNEYVRQRTVDTGEDLDSRVGQVRQDKMHVDRTVTEFLGHLREQVTVIANSQRPKADEDLRFEEMAGLFQGRLSYQSMAFQDVFESEKGVERTGSGVGQPPTGHGTNSSSEIITQRRLRQSDSKSKTADHDALSNLGLKWVETPDTPEKGREVMNPALARALQQKHEFSHDELDKMGVSGKLSYESFIKVVDKCFVPIQPRIAFMRSLTGMKLLKKRFQRRSHVDSEDVFDRDDSLPERQISPGSAISTGSLFKLAEIFSWIGTEEEVAQGSALMSEVEFVRICMGFALSKHIAPFRLNWNDFLDFLIEVARTCVKQVHVKANVELEDTSSSATEALFWFMSLPQDTISRRNWLVERAADVMRFRLYDRVGNERPRSTWLVPPANQPWRHGLILQNDVQEVQGADVQKRLIDGNPSKLAPADAWSFQALPTRPLGRVPSISRLPSNPSRTPSTSSPPRTVLHTEPNSSMGILSRLSSAANISRCASSASNTEAQSWFCIMFCDSRRDGQGDRDSHIFQALAWRHELRFFRCDLAQHSSSRDFAQDHNVTSLPCMRLYCINGLYREFTGHWDLGTLDWWFDEQHLPEDAKDTEHCSLYGYDAVVQYFESDDGVGAYLDTYLSLSNSCSEAGMRAPDPMRNFSSVFSGPAIELRNMDLSGPEVLSLASGLQHNCRLTSVTLDNCRIKSDGLVAILLALALNNSIKILSITGLPASSTCWHAPYAAPPRRDLPAGGRNYCSLLRLSA